METELANRRSLEHSPSLSIRRPLTFPDDGPSEPRSLSEDSNGERREDLAPDEEELVTAKFASTRLLAPWFPKTDLKHPKELT